MSLHRFIVGGPLTAGPASIADHEFRNQVKNVLRLQPGEALVLCDGKGNEAPATLVGVGAASVEVEVGSVRPNEAEPRAAVTLYCAVLKRENFELVVQKATEAGASRIVPVVSARTVKTGVRIDRLAKIAKEATEQCGRGTVPEVTEPLSMRQAIADAAGQGVNIIFERQGAPLAALSETATVGVWVGPEGGWSPEELDAFRAAGFRIATLGPRTYRAETAAIVATHLLAQ